MSKRELSPQEKAAAKVLARAVKESPLTHDLLAAQIGVTPGMIHQWTKPLRPVALERAPALANAVGIADPATICPAYGEFIREVREFIDAQNDEQWLEIVAYKQTAAGGDGSCESEFPEPEMMKFPARQIKQRGLHHRQLAVFIAAGDSMEPRIRSGAELLIDQEDVTARDGRIYVLLRNREYIVKRLEKYGEQWFLVSDNVNDPKWARPVPVEFSEECQILGRVRWIGSWED